MSKKFKIAIRNGRRFTGIFIIAFLFQLVELSGQLSAHLYLGVTLSNYSTRLYDRAYHERFKQYYKYAPLFNFGLSLNKSIDHYEITTGVGINQRGYRDYLPPPFVNGEYLLSESTFLEIPFLYTYRTHYFKNKLGIGGGILYNCRLHAGEHVYGEEEFGFDIKALLDIKLSKRFKTEFTFTFGNFDKILRNKRMQYVHYIYGLNLVYKFMEI
ncbi:MAG: hypothetical protein IPM92_12100 [Saprospiraceae bacterium]|nr:hypothetical protein [Saprospiraceae bacterium]